MQDTLSGALQVTAVAMGIVFAVLAGLALVTHLLRLTSLRPATAQTGGDLHAVQTYVGPPVDTSGGAPAPGPQEDGSAIPPATVAAIAGALSVYLDRPVRMPRAQAAPAGQSSAWAQAGRQALMATRRQGSR